MRTGDQNCRMNRISLFLIFISGEELGNSGAKGGGGGGRGRGREMEEEKGNFNEALLFIHSRDFFSFSIVINSPS